MSIRRFLLERKSDPTGVSGTGRVAEGCVFTDGTTVVRWLSETATTTVHNTIESVETIHCHVGQTQILWEDPICWQCAAVLMMEEQTQRHCTACGTQQGKLLCYMTRLAESVQDNAEVSEYQCVICHLVVQPEDLDATYMCLPCARQRP